MTSEPFAPRLTDRLVLRCLRPSDAMATSRLMTPGVSRWLASWPGPGHAGHGEWTDRRAAPPGVPRLALRRHGRCPILGGPRTDSEVNEIVEDTWAGWDAHLLLPVGRCSWILGGTNLVLAHHGWRCGHSGRTAVLRPYSWRPLDWLRGSQKTLGRVGNILRPVGRCSSSPNLSMADPPRLGTGRWSLSWRPAGRSSRNATPWL